MTIFCLNDICVKRLRDEGNENVRNIFVNNTKHYHDIYQEHSELNRKLQEIAQFLATRSADILKAELCLELELDLAKFFSPIYFCYLNAFVLRNRALDSIKNNDVLALESNHIEFVVDRFDDFRSSLGWNSGLNMLICEMLMENRDPKVEYIELPNSDELYIKNTQNNLLFSPLGSTKKNKRFLIRILNRVSSWLRRGYSFRKRSLVRGFSGDDYALGLAGFYTFHGFKIHDFRAIFRSKECDIGFRDDFFTQVCGSIIESDYASFFSDEKLDIILFKKFLVTFFPKTVFESLQENLIAAIEQFTGPKKANIRFQRYLGADLISDEDYFLSLAANALGIPSCGMQHSGHYGYICDNAFVESYEFGHCSSFYCFGWGGGSCDKFINIPSPRLSELAKTGSVVRMNFHGQAKKFDILFCLNLIHRYPPAGLCGQGRIEYRNFILNELQNCIISWKAANMQFKIKPFWNYFPIILDSGDRYSQLLGEIKNFVFDDFAKGFDVLSWGQARVVIFDQVGSGVIDLWTLKLPCLVYCPEIYSKLASDRVVLDLKKVGFVCETLIDLNDHLDSIIANGFDAWLSKYDRAIILDRFLERYALADPDWREMWLREFALHD